MASTSSRSIRATRSRPPGRSKTLTLYALAIVLDDDRLDAGMICTCAVTLDSLAREVLFLRRHWRSG
jgi:hypothetical protein